MTVEILQANYEKCKRLWEASSCRKEFLQILDKKQPDDGWQLDSAICIASGSFSQIHTQRGKRGMLQFAAFMDTIIHVQKTSDEQIKVYAEELVYNDIDIAFLTSLGVTVIVHSDPNKAQQSLQDPALFSHMGPQSMVFELYIDPWEPALRRLLKADPKLLVGSQPEKKLLSLVQAFPSATECDDRALIKKFDKERASYYLPQFDEDLGIFEGLRVCWKEPVDDESQISAKATSFL